MGSAEKSVSWAMVFKQVNVINFSSFLVHECHQQLQRDYKKRKNMFKLVCFLIPSSDISPWKQLKKKPHTSLGKTQKKKEENWKCIKALKSVQFCEKLIVIKIVLSLETTDYKASFITTVQNGGFFSCIKCRVWCDCSEVYVLHRWSWNYKDCSLVNKSNSVKIHTCVQKHLIYKLQNYHYICRRILFYTQVLMFFLQRIPQISLSSICSLG